MVSRPFVPVRATRCGEWRAPARWGSSNWLVTAALPWRPAAGAGVGVARRVAVVRVPPHAATRETTRRSPPRIRAGPSCLPVAVDAPEKAAIVAEQSNRHSHVLEERDHRVNRPHRRAAEIERHLGTGDVRHDQIAGSRREAKRTTWTSNVGSVHSLTVVSTCAPSACRDRFRSAVVR